MMLSRTYVGILLILFSTLVNWLAQPNEIFLGGSWLFGLVAYVPLYMFFVRGLENVRNSARIGALYGLISTLSSYFWLAHFGDFSLWTIGTVSLGYMGVYAALFRVMHSLLAPQHSLPFKKRSMLMSGSVPMPIPALLPRYAFPAYRPLLFAITWASFEFFKSKGYLAFPWNLAAFPFHNWLVLNQVVELAGVWLVSFAILFLQGALGEMLCFGGGSRSGRSIRHEQGAGLRNLRMGYLACALSMLFLFSLYGVLRLDALRRQPAEDSSSLVVLLVQQNADSWAQGDPIGPLEAVIELSIQGIEESEAVYGKKPDLVSWSETSLRYPYGQNFDFYAVNPPEISVRDYLRLSDTDLISGAPLFRDSSTYLNGVVHIDKNGRLLGDYGKIHLIPFAEHIPLSDLPFFSNFLETVIGLPGGGWTSGNKVETMYLEAFDLKIGTPICFEDSFANNSNAFVRHGADILLNLTNNSWSRTESAQMQHFVAARYRAIETRRPLLRSTNGGLTTIVLPDGSIHAEIPMFQPGYLLAELEVSNDKAITIYTFYGDWFAWLLVAGLVFALTLQYRRNAPRA